MNCEAKKNISSQSVIDFLCENPEFFDKNPEVLEKLINVHAGNCISQNGSNVSDFRSFMIKRLRSDKENVMRTTHEIVENTRANINNQQRINNAVLAVLDACCFEEFINTLIIDVCAILDVDIISLVIESEGDLIPHININGVRVVPEGTLSDWMQGKTVLLQSNIQGIEAIYGGGAALVNSQALVAVNLYGTSPVLMAFGSRNPLQFDESQATDQINFFAKVIERCFYIWLRANR